MSSRRDDARRVEVVAASLELIHRHGLDAFDLKRLSFDLGLPERDLVELVGDRHQLLHLCLEAIVADVALPTPTADDWLEQGRELAMAFWEAVARYPGVSHHIVTFQHVSPSMLRIVEVGVEILIQGGFDEGQASELFMALASQVLARAALDAHRLLEWGWDEVGQVTTREQFLGVERWRSTAEEAGLEHLPRVASYLERTDEWRWSRDVFAKELDLMLRGIDSLPR